MISVEARTVLVRIPVRQTRGGTPNIQDIARRGEGGVRLLIGNGRDAMMTEADKALTEEARAAIVAGRQTLQIEEIKMPGESPAVPIDLGLLFDPKSNRVAMRGEVTIGQMKRFVEETRYNPKGDNAGQFNELIAEGNASSPMVFTNEADCLAFIGWVLTKAQASDTRIQTLALPSDSEWVGMRQAFRGQQTGSTWERLSDNYFRSFRFESRNDHYYGPEFRCGDNAFRLVGTYKS
ncbi:MAG: hypothetical protein NT099_04500 [Candidatus Saganbacteria bacterium]|nr:hypothetical protein [Candidatus Saganbacteria bacterium]